MSPPTVAEYTLRRIAALGIDRVFGVPGDYAFAIDDAVEKVDEVDWVVCANELNAAYAADGYARIRGAALLTTTYGVGELSALNGVMGAKAHRLAVFHLVGMPSDRIRRLGLITHHNLGEPNYDRYQSISAQACCASAVLTPDNCVEELERVISEALRRSMPAYLVIPEANGVTPVIGEPVAGVPLAQVTRGRSAPAELDAAVAEVLSRLAGATAPVALLTALTARYGVRDTAVGFVTKAGLPVAITSYDKGVVDESLPNYAGLYGGQSSHPARVRQTVEDADLVLDIGGVLLTELNTGMWSTELHPARMVSIHDTWVRSGEKVFINVAIGDLLEALLAAVPAGSPAAWFGAGGPQQLAITGSGPDPTTSANFYPRLQAKLRTGDTLVIETGTAMFHLNPMRLPAGVGAEAQGLWGSIGWATPATLGIALAKTSGRTWLVTGDGSHQLTLNELAVMGRYRVDPVIFVLNNGLYGVEDVISERGHVYDDLAAVRYHLLPEALGCTGWLSRKVSTVAELDAVLAELDSHQGAAYIEVMIPGAESQPLPAAAIDRAYKVRVPSAD
jgi:indolepyruvate decarboxylase